MDIQGWAAGVSRGEERTGAALLRAAQAGDPAALDQLLSPHARGLLLFCRGILGHAEDAEDAAQETLFRALRALPRFQQRLQREVGRRGAVFGGRHRHLLC